MTSKLLGEAMMNWWGARLSVGVLAALVAASPFVDLLRSQNVDGTDVSGVSSALAKSGVEAAYNPFGDDWAAKKAPNPSIPVGHTPGCHRLGPKADLPAPPADELAFLGKSNHPILFEKCAEISEDSPQIRASGEAIQRVNPSLKYVGYLPVHIASTGKIGGPGPYTVALREFDVQEAFFLHKAGTDPSLRENRITSGSQTLYDLTNPDFRHEMVIRIKRSMDSHKLGGVVIDSLGEAPLVPDLHEVDPQKRAAWFDACVAFMRELKSGVGADKFAFYTGFPNSPRNVFPTYEFTDLFLRNSDGLIWEDPLGPVSTDLRALPEGPLERLDKIYDLAKKAGNKYVGIVVNTNENGTTAATTNAATEHQYARYYLAEFLLAYQDTSKTPLIYYTPAEGARSFTDTFFKDWDIHIGTSIGPRLEVRRNAEGVGSVYSRPFRFGEVWLNNSNATYNMIPTRDLITADLRRIDSGTTFLMPPKTGMVFLNASGGPIVGPPPPGPLRCAPRPRVVVTRTFLDANRAKITVAVAQPPRSTGNRLLDLQFVIRRNPNGVNPNGVIVIDRKVLRTSATVTMPVGTLKKEFIISRTIAGRVAELAFVVTDRCGAITQLARR